MWVTFFSKTETKLRISSNKLNEFLILQGSLLNCELPLKPNLRYHGLKCSLLIGSFFPVGIKISWANYLF
jgi:hypothetical protein